MSTDDEDFEKVFRDEFTSVVRTVYLVCHDHHRAEEVAQEAFLQMLRHWEQVRAFDRPGAWVRRVAIRLAVKTVRRDQRRWWAERETSAPSGREGRDEAVMDAYADCRRDSARPSLCTTSRTARSTRSPTCSAARRQRPGCTSTGRAPTSRES